MNGFDLRIRIDAENRVATAEVLLADGSCEMFDAAAITGDFNDFMVFYMTAMANIRGNWIGALHAWTSAWSDAAVADGIAIFDKFARGLRGEEVP